MRANEVKYRQRAPTDYSRFLYLIFRAAVFELEMESVLGMESVESIVVISPVGVNFDSSR